MELLDVRDNYILQFENKFYHQKEGTIVGNSLSPVVSNIFMEQFEEAALDTADHKRAKCLRHLADTFVLWPLGPASWQQLLQHLKSLRPAMKFKMEEEEDEACRKSQSCGKEAKASELNCRKRETELQRRREDCAPCGESEK
jgi:hypothetical protein